MHEQVKPRRSVPNISFPDQLPVVEQRELISEAILGHQVVIIAGETGSKREGMAFSIVPPYVALRWCRKD